MANKTKELTFLKLNHIRDQTQLQSPLAGIYVNLLLIYLLEKPVMCFSPLLRFSITKTASPRGRLPKL
jgi:hypothetical protein